MKINMTDGLTTKECPIGFNAASFFFPGLVILYRKDWSIFGKYVLAGIVLLILSFILNTPEIIDTIIGIGINIFIARNYNKWYLEGLIEKGYKPSSQDDEFLLNKEYGIEVEKASGAEV